jgi:hypothetical protein
VNTIGDSPPLIEQRDLNQIISTIKARIGDEAYETAYQSGWGLDLDEAVACASGRKEYEA